jgi:hypothetical protein
VWTALYGLVVAIIDFAVLEALKTGFKRRAAAIQGQFDCQVLRLPWSGLKGGSKSDPENILFADESDALFMCCGIGMFLTWPRSRSTWPDHLSALQLLVGLDIAPLLPRCDIERGVRIGRCDLINSRDSRPHSG